MILKTIVLALFLGCTFAFAAEHEGGTDIVPRTVNFIIFVGLLYYMMADKIKDFFVGRTNEIAEQIKSVQVKVDTAKSELKEAEAKKEEAKRLATDLVEAAKKEAVMLAAKAVEDANREMANLDKNFQDECDILRKKAVSAVVCEVMSETIERDGLGVGNEKIVEIVNKKVA